MKTIQAERQAALVFRGENEGRASLVAPDGLSIGRSPDNDLVLKDPSVSRHHCRLTPFGDHWLLEDLGSTNGVFLNGVRVETQCRVDADDRVDVGDAKFVLSLITDQTDTEALAEKAAAAEKGRFRSATDPAELEADKPEEEPAAPPAPAASDRLIRMIGTPYVLYQVTVRAKLETKKDITRNGTISLNRLGGTGNLARNFTGAGLLKSGVFGKRYIRLDDFRISGRAELVLSAKLLLPKATDVPGDATLVDTEFRLGLDITVPTLADSHVLAGAEGRIAVSNQTETISVLEAGAGPGETRQVLGESRTAARRFLQAVTKEDVERYLESAVAVHAFDRAPGEIQLQDTFDAELEDRLVATSGKAAKLYRHWCKRAWQGTMAWHDSQLLIGEIRYTFNVSGEPHDNPQALGMVPIYRALL